MFKKSKVVMLPTEKESKIGIHNKLGLITATSQGWDFIVKQDYIQPQHLYFLSDEEIKESDWIYRNVSTKSIIQKCNKESVNSIAIKEWKKIIASTDPELKIDTDIFIKGERYKSLPRPSDKFLHKYCELGGIDEVMVEYYEDIYFRYELQAREKLKVALDNTITIKPVVERTYTESEVNALLHSLAQYLRNVVIIEERVKLKTASNEWIKQNL